jgi:hypothetical protein
VVYAAIPFLFGKRFSKLIIDFQHAFGLDEKFLELGKESIIPSDAKLLEDRNLLEWSNTVALEGLRQGKHVLFVF